jgi:hypothetical protein
MYIVDSSEIFNKYCVRLHGIVNDRVKRLSGEALDDHEDGEEFIEAFGFAIGVIKT